MKNIILLISLLTFTSLVKAQNYDFPTNPKAGKCYLKCFDYNKKFKWKEVDCSLKLAKKNEKTKKELIKCEQQKIKMGKYQEKLKALGYEVDITKIADNKTIIAHHKYLKHKKKEEKRNRKVKME
jgi:aryl carrier-like protein